MMGCGHLTLGDRAFPIATPDASDPPVCTVGERESSTLAEATLYYRFYFGVLIVMLRS